MLEVTHGQTRNQIVAVQLVNLLSELDLDGSLYIGYPVVATADESVTVDALLITKQHGLIAFLFDEHVPDLTTEDETWLDRQDRQDYLFVAVENSLRRHPALRKGRRLAVDVEAITIMTEAPQVPTDIFGKYSQVESLDQLLSTIPPLDDHYYRPLQAALQRVTTIKPTKRRARVSSAESKGAILKKLESEIANLDQWQKRAAIESPEGPQRIRGLAGSGKTVVLALKAAYLHALNPEWTIAVIFWSRTLYQQFEDLVRRFSFEHSNDEPNWSNLQILHAWGGRDREGVYRQISEYCGLVPRDYLYAKTRFGMDNAFHGICQELWSAISKSDHEPLYDAVLIDEAQDLPQPFFRIIHQMTRDPKRIIWAYDELQNLSNSSLPTIDRQFGKDTHGHANVNLVDSPNSPRQDIVLQVCYRNTPWALALAHGLGLGTSRPDGLVQSFDDPSLWREIGYGVVDGDLTRGSTVTLERTPSSYPEYLTKLISKEDAVSTHIFPSDVDQATWVANSIQVNLTEDELDHDDILIVLPDAYTSRSEAGLILDALDDLGIPGHLAGVTASQDEIFKPDSIAIANIYRSKGNESPMVYILNSQHCVASRRLATARNILFTAITRSKAWVRICGWGNRMAELQKEIESIQNHNYRLRFQVPTDEELDSMRQIHRDMTASEKATLDEAERALRDVLTLLDRGEVSADDLPDELRSAAARHLGTID